MGMEFHREEEREWDADDAEETQMEMGFHREEE